MNPVSNNYVEMVWQLKEKSPVLFQSLVKMHLSFCIEQNSDDVDSDCKKNNDKNTPHKKTKAPSKISKPNEQLFPYMHKLIDFLANPDHLAHEGVFRKSGKFKQQQELQNILYNNDASEKMLDEVLNSGTYTVHEVATVLKNILADTSEPLLTENYYELHCKIAKLNQMSRQLRSLQLLFLLLPKENYVLLQKLLFLLSQIAVNAEQNKMNSLNLGTMLGPHILCPRKTTPEELTLNAGILAQATSFMIDNAQNIFQIPLEFINDVRLHLDAEKKREEDVCSTASTPPIKTSITFVDREMTAKLVADGDPTAVALAELYAFVQSQPESEVKKKWVHKFNKENGCGTPKIVQSSVFMNESCSKAGKNLAHSIKKHLFKNSNASNVSATPNRRRSKSASRNVPPPYYMNGSSPVLEDEVQTPRLKSFRAHSESRRTLSNPDADSVLSTPASDFIRHPAYACHRSRCLSETQENISPLTQSASKLPPNVRETIMTPRCRRPVFTFSPIDEPNEVIINESSIQISRPDEEEPNPPAKTLEPEENDLAEAFKQYLLQRDIQVCDFEDLPDPEDLLSESLREILDGQFPEENTRTVGSPTVQPLHKSIVFETSL